MSNPLLQAFTGPIGTAPFSQIKPAHFLPAFEQRLQEAYQEIDAITTLTEAPNFSNTIEALEAASRGLDQVSSLFFNLYSVITDETLQNTAQQVSPKLAAFGNDVMLNADLFARVKTVFDQRDSLNLNPAQQMLLKKSYEGFMRQGANLSGADKERLRDIDRQLSEKSLAYGDNVRKATDSYELLITDKSQLNGLTERALEEAQEAAKSADKEGYLFTLQYPSYWPLVSQADDRQLRQTIHKAMGSRALGGDHDNQTILLDIARLRQERAKLLGYNSHADFVLEKRMAKNPTTVHDFLDELITLAKAPAQKEFAELQDKGKTEGITELMPWDGAYLSEKLKKERFDLDDEQLKPYFPLPQVWEGLCTVLKKLYGIQFEVAKDIESYHDDVVNYRIFNASGDLLSVLYTDLFARKGKRSGAWMTTFREQWLEGSENVRPHVSVVCNFAKPTSKAPSLLTFNDVTTLFHEMGHALHATFSQVQYASQSGAHVEWDFVELPSQLLENWCYEEEVLSLFAKHYQTGDALPTSLIAKLKEARSFLGGMQTLRQVGLGKIDMAYHHNFSPEKVSTVETFESQATESTRLYPKVVGVCTSTAFSHIFQGGYSAGYYSYKWSEVLEADAYEHFLGENHQVFDQEKAQRFLAHVLSQGGTQNPDELYRAFRGKDASIQALVKRSGW